VDAALDLSHTQNIGEMLRKHFSGSQFLIISHKEAMFDNANALFHCALVDGSTQVTRTSGRPKAIGAGAAQRQKI
jgi:structural maintenance of chromosome 2